jgi:hypothetical protein
MAHPGGLSAGRNLDELQGQKIAAAGEMDEGAAATAAQPRPGRRLDR